jgi:hypothetical protein
MRKAVFMPARWRMPFAAAAVIGLICAFVWHLPQLKAVFASAQLSDPAKPAT